ncbi:MAG TPA: hypothetical protein VED01_03295 [Burkholderiales bacterium]|nr:hypothetical protein [Burkholderiales bacterium]
MENVSALRPTMPPEPDAQQRWLLERQIEAMVRLSTATEQLTVAVGELRQLVSVLLSREPAE